MVNDQHGELIERELESPQTIRLCNESKAPFSINKPTKPPSGGHSLIQPKPYYSKSLYPREVSEIQPLPSYPHTIDNAIPSPSALARHAFGYR